MILTEYFRGAFRALRAHKLRSGLTVSSITVGAFSIVLMSSLAVSGLLTLSQDIESLGGARILFFAAKVPERERAKADKAPGHITTQDRDVLYDALPHIEARTMFSTLGRVDAIDSLGKTVRTDLVAGDAGFFRAFDLGTALGRTFDEAENRNHARVCVLGFETTHALFGDASALGEWITVDGSRCRVIGTIANVDHMGVDFDFDWRAFVAMPFETAADTRPLVRTGSTLLLRSDDKAANDIVKRIANALLTERHHGVDDFQIFDLSGAMSQFQSMFVIMEIVVGLIAGIALLVGGVGVMNMVLVSVSERRREIGIRRALGATPSAIAHQFLWEATMLAGVGGVVGVLMGALAAAGANVFVRTLKPTWAGEISWVAVFVALAASLAMGVGFGLFPAKRASRLTPVDAIRG